MQRGEIKKTYDYLRFISHHNKILNRSSLRARGIYERVMPRLESFIARVIEMYRK